MATRTPSRIDIGEIEFHLDYIDPTATADTFAAQFDVTVNAISTQLRRKRREDLRERLRRNRARHVRFGYVARERTAA